MRRFNYFDDADDVRARGQGGAVKDGFTAFFEICKRPVSQKLDEIKQRQQAGESLVKILFGEVKKRQKTVRIATVAICILVLVLTVSIPARLITQNAKKESAFRQDAGAVCSSLISEYGIGKAEVVAQDSGSQYYALKGFSYVRQIDFDNDSKYELLTVYESGGEYCIEVWGYVKGEFSKIYSVAANGTDSAELGAWLSLYNRSGRYYIGVLADDGATMQLFTKSKNKFKAKKECLYDAPNDIYAIDDKIDGLDFETVRLSYISGGKAQDIIDGVSAVTEQFVISDVSSDDNGGDLSEKQLYSLYAETVKSLEAQYGEAEYEQLSGVHSAKGLCVVRLIDFNGDKIPELLVVFSYDKRVLSTAANGDSITITRPSYKLRVYGKNGRNVKMIYETDALTTFRGSETEQFYILQTSGGKTNLCNNTYSYSAATDRVWKATSRIRAMTDSMKFETAFTAVANCSWGYMSYSIDGVSVYSREFAQRGYQVPYFCADTADYDEDEFTVAFVRGGASYASDVQSTVNETKAQLKALGVK